MQAAFVSYMGIIKMIKMIKMIKIKIFDRKKQWKKIQAL